MLHTIRHGSDTARPPLLIVPGLFGSARNWGVVAKHLSTERLVIAVDQRNHGDSFWSDDHSYPAMAGDLAEVIEAEGRPLDVLGHSMGGKAVMMLALTRPELVHCLIVADIAPVTYPHTGTNEALIAAMKALKIDDLTTRGEADRRLAPGVPDPATRAFLLQSLELRDGPVHWKLNLDALQANMGRIVGWPDPLPVGARPFTGPALFLYGGTSRYLRPDYRPAIEALFPQTEYEGIAGAGHWLHAEKPRETEAAIEAFLSR
ncbi:alpha/beta fold hydrolase [Paenirhodobacter populi]|uniref:alpha/beta fold hydrolase n=1 Tax=Paenirhodobacter populi TaxID=2306993 RepID=UPI000FE396E2|nr:alpha/beta fold hydrolase [Sinirhodobacter populi]RWR09829.1 alpha/beta fold hydrolase [Sinirhodobacter populi]